MAKLLIEPASFSGRRSVSSVEYRRVPAALSARQFGLVASSNNPCGDKAPGRAIHEERVNAAPIARRQIHLSRADKRQRRTIRPHIRDKRPVARPRVRLRLRQRSEDRPTARQGGGFQKRTAREGGENHRGVIGGFGKISEARWETGACHALRVLRKNKRQRRFIIQPRLRGTNCPGYASRQTRFASTLLGSVAW